MMQGMDDDDDDSLFPTEKVLFKFAFLLETFIVRCASCQQEREDINK